MPFSTIIFDAYGTLIDTADSSIRSLGKVLRTRGCEADAAEVYRQWKVHCRAAVLSMSDFQPEAFVFAEGLGQIYKAYGIDGDPTEDTRTFLSALDGRMLFADVKPCLTSLRARHRIAIASNTDTAPFLRDLRANDLTVDEWFTSESLKVYKPHRAFYERILTGLGCHAREVVFVGDTVDADVTGPSRLGMKGIWLNRGDEPATAAGGFPTLRSLSELEPLIGLPSGT